MREIALNDRIIAEGQSVGSFLIQFWPRLQQRIGNPNLASYVPLQWRHARLARTAIANWQVLSGDPESGSVPSSFASAAKISVDKQEMDQLVRRYSGCQAAAYALGSTVMYGTLHSASFMGTDPDDSGRYAYHAGIGPGDLYAVAGVYSRGRVCSSNYGYVW